MPFETRNPKQFRNAPSFRPAGKKFNKDKFLKPYNAESIAKFLGWMSGRSIDSAITRRLVAEVDIAAGNGLLAGFFVGCHDTRSGHFRPFSTRFTLTGENAK